MFDRYYKGPTGGDETAPYGVMLKRKCTLKEFIEAVIEKYPDEWGHFDIRTDNWKKAKFGQLSSVSYSHGTLDRNLKIPKVFEETYVKEVNASGGWSRMDYIIRTDLQGI